MKKISVIIPMYNEEKVIDECYKRIKKVCDGLKDFEYELIFVNDGSRDNTFDLLKRKAKKDKNAKVISFSRNFGHQNAVTAALEMSCGDAVVIIDADMQDPPELIPDMINLWAEGNEVVYAKRKARKGESKFKILTAKMFYKTLKTLADVDIPLDTGDFRLVDRKVINVINKMPEHNKFYRGLFAWIGFRQIPIEYERDKRFAGKTNYSLKKMIKLALDGIIGFSSKPLKIVGGIGIIAIILSILILIYSLVSYIFNLNNLTPGWTSIMITVTFFSGMQLLAIWIMSEYIARIYDESKKRPEYIIDQMINFDENKDSNNNK